jgi:hypothetical protein
MKQFYFAALLACSLLTGCKTAPTEVNLYQGPGMVEIRHRHHEEGLLLFDTVEVWGVDNKFIGATYIGAVTRLSPGKHDLIIHRMFKPGISDLYEGYMKLTVDLRPDAHLVMNGKTDGIDNVVWLEDATTGEQVSDTSRAPWRPVATSTTVPIFIPKR